MNDKHDQSLQFHLLSDDPFKTPLIPRFRHFSISIVRDTAAKKDLTLDFVQTIKAITCEKPREPILIPKTAEFFDFEKISDYELSFNFAHFPIYKEIRNFMVIIYRIFSSHYLPFTLCRRNIEAPAHITLQIYNFLSQVGLINYRKQPGFQEKTVPPPIVPPNTTWPTLVFFPNQNLTTLSNFSNSLHPKPPEVPLIFPQFSMIGSMMNAPRVSRTSPQWTQEEMAILSKGMKEGLGWEEIASKLKNRSTTEIAATVARMGFYIPDIENQSNISFNDYKEPCEMMKEVAYSNMPSLRLVTRAVKATGDDMCKKIFRGEDASRFETNDSEKCAGYLTMEKIAKNAHLMEIMHKRRVLECLAKTVEILKQDISIKQSTIQEALTEKSEIQSEFESDDKSNQSDEANSNYD